MSSNVIHSTHSINLTKDEYLICLLALSNEIQHIFVLGLSAKTGSFKNHFLSTTLKVCTFATSAKKMYLESKLECSLYPIALTTNDSLGFQNQLIVRTFNQHHQQAVILGKKK